MAEIKITKDNFEHEVLASDIPVLVDFWAPWCGPCQMLSPIIEEVAALYEGKVKVGKINVDEEGELAMTFRVMSIPTLMVFKGGQPVSTTVGLCSKEDIENLIG